MSVDVEDYFQVQAFAGQVDRRDWAEMPCRVERNTDAVLQLFADLEVRATFFMLGWVAQRYPALARRIVDAGHELASHGYAHQRVMEQSPEQFREDIRSTKQILEAAGGAPVRGFRAASFSIGETTGWAYPILAEEGYVYSSSIYPIRHDLYGRPRAPRFDHRPRDGKAATSGSCRTACRSGGSGGSTGGTAGPACSISIPGRSTRISPVSPGSPSGRGFATIPTWRAWSRGCARS
jgi:polysaccharide deacetylase family protein (PEP-CTERM system associated)